MERAKKTILSVILLVVLALVPNCLADSGRGPAGAPELRLAAAPPVAPAADTITIATFNIQTFGEAKAKEPEVMKVLAQTVGRFDLVAIQEIRDDTGTAIQNLERLVDALGRDYAVITSPRLGRTVSKEQYAFIYRKDRVAPVGEAITYQEPPGKDPFERDPYMARFKCAQGKFGFVLITVHTKPTDAKREIPALKDVLTFARQKFPGEGDFIILGDLNADCDYYHRKLPNPIPGATWLFQNVADTTVKSTKCAYDDIIITDACKEDFTGEAQVFRFDQEYGLAHEQAVKVSDHFPIWARFYTNRDTN
jgi:endonuclease/exonuclease/phosphatase family metal-dependent hydrolase